MSTTALLANDLRKSLPSWMKTSKFSSGQGGEYFLFRGVVNSY